MDYKKVTTTETVETYDLSTDDIENIIREHYNYFGGGIDFTWNNGQFISLKMRVVTQETTVE